MKLVGLVLIVLFGLISCGGNSSSGGSAPPPPPPPAPAPLVVRPGGPPVASGTDYGSTNGKPGGPCRPEIADDYRALIMICRSGSDDCRDAMVTFVQMHPNANCQGTDENGATFTVQSQSFGVTNAAQSGSPEDVLFQ